MLTIIILTLTLKAMIHFSSSSYKGVIRKLESKSYTLGNLAQECNLTFARLEKPIQRISDFEYDQLVLSITQSITQKAMSKILNVLRNGSTKEKASLDIGPELYGFVLEQYRSSKELASISQIAEENHFDKRIVNSILYKWNKYNWQLVHKNFVTNIFKSTKHYYVPNKKKNIIVQLLLAQMAVENTAQSGWVKTSDVALPTRNNSIEVNLLEQVQNVNSTKGRVISFGKRDDHVIVPIVRWYNGSISFAPILQRSPRTSTKLNYKKLKRNKRVCSFIIPIKDISDQKNGKRNIQIFNAFLRMLEGKPVEISISLKSLLQPLNNSSSNAGRIYFKTNQTKFNLDDLELEDETQNARLEREKAYGKNGVTNEEMVEFLNRYADKNTNTQVTLTKSKANPVSIYSTSYPITVFVKDRSSFALLAKRAKESNQSIGEYFKTLSDLNEEELQLSIYQADSKVVHARDQEKLEQKIGKHVLAKDNLSFDNVKDNRTLVRQYLIDNNINDKEIRDIILDDPLTVKSIAEKLQEGSSTDQDDEED